LSDKTRLIALCRKKAIFLAASGAFAKWHAAPHEFLMLLYRMTPQSYTRERWICDYFIVSHAARLASNAGNDEIILLLSARGHNIISNQFAFEAKADSSNWHRRTRYRSLRNFKNLNHSV
jgi:hypothetical protein